MASLLVLNAERISMDETTTQALRLVKETIQLHGSCSDVPVTHQLISAVHQPHSNYLSYLDSEKQKVAKEAEQRMIAEKTAEVEEGRRNIASILRR